MAGADCDYDQCFSDADCMMNQVCSCDGSYGGGGNICVSADCRTNSDCTSGRCSPSYGCLLGGTPVGWYCRTAGDACASDSDCTAMVSGRCAFDTMAGIWSCQYIVCTP